MGKKYTCEIVGDEIKCKDDDGKIETIGYTKRKLNISIGTKRAAKRGGSIGYPLFCLFTYFIGAIVYQNYMVTDYGSPILNFFMAGLFFLFFDLLLWLVFFANLFAGMWVFAQQSVWEQNLLNFVGLTDKTLLSEVYYGIAKWTGIIGHIILIIALAVVIIVLIVFAIRVLLDSLPKREEEASE